jgi:C-terminal processing protease CtpA/Prc
VAADAPQSVRPRGPEGLEEARMIGEVAYLRFNMLPIAPGSGDAARAFLLAHADAKAVIIDARPLRGGGEPVMDALLPLFYAQPTKLLRLDMRASGPDDDGEPTPAMVRQPAPAGIIRFDHQVTPDSAETRLRRTPVYYLTSRRTASAGEHLALALKRTGRATLIGETTAGAGHFGWIAPLPNGFAGFVPIGRTYDPDTGFDWEGRGVTPDVEVPADAALDEALARISRAPGAELEPSVRPAISRGSASGVPGRHGRFLVPPAAAARA